MPENEEEQMTFEMFERRMNKIVRFLVTAYVIMVFGFAGAFWGLNNNHQDQVNKAKALAVAVDRVNRSANLKICKSQNSQSTGATQFIDSSLASSKLANQAIIASLTSSTRQRQVAELRLSQINGLHQDAVRHFKILDCSHL